MPLFLVQTRKALNTGGIAAKWSNRYFGEVSDASAALALGLNIWQYCERTFHSDLAFCYSIYVNQMGDAPNTPGIEQAVPEGIQRGGIVRGPGRIAEILPLWNVVRVDFPVAASRPSRKFYRVPLEETHITSAQLTPEMLTLFNTGLAALDGLGELRDVDGQVWVGAGIVRGLTSRRLGRDAARSVPPGPPFG